MTDGKSMTPEQFRTLLTVMHRIADAFEEQNRLSARLIDEDNARYTRVYKEWLESRKHREEQPHD